MNIGFGPEIILSYKRLSYTPWYALVEFIDNSTQSYFDNRKLLDDVYKIENTSLTVKVEDGSDVRGQYIKISDNSIGMDEDTLKNAVVIGKPPKNISGRSKYGLGMKTAAFWLGDFWTVETKKLGEAFSHKITVDVEKVADGITDLSYIRSDDVNAEDHFTIITIRNLHRNLRPNKTAGKIRDYLSSIYRNDFMDYGLKLFWRNDLLFWNRKVRVEDRLITDKFGDKAIKDFEFFVKDKKVRGWVGVFEVGSRRDAGFSIMQNNRVIIGWPASYRPWTLFGDQEGGSNDLVNQRLVGELFMDGFEVSHTKDEILFENDEQEILEFELAEVCDSYRKLALSFRKNLVDERGISEADISSAINEFEIEINSIAVKDFIKTYSVPSANLIRESNLAVKESIIKKFSPNIKAILGEVSVYLYIVGDMSPNDPYVIIESTLKESMVIVIINRSHPHWKQLTKVESILNFIRHCVYDGVAEWKAFFMTNRLDPDTIKLIKDNLLRVSFKMKMENKN